MSDSEEEREAAAGFEEMMNRPLRGMSVEEHEQRLNDNLLERHDEWRKELREATLKALTNKADIIAARSSFAHAAKMDARTWYQAKAKLQMYGQIHAWAFNDRLGLPKRYHTEGYQIVYAFMHGLPWEDWHAYDSITHGCMRCDEEFENSYKYSIHPCAMRSTGVGSPSLVEEKRAA